MAWKILLLPALFISLLLMVPSHCIVDPTSTTLAIIQATSTVCGITTSSHNHRIQCAEFPELAVFTASFPIYPTMSFEAISDGHNFICGLRSDGSAFLCWDGIGQHLHPVCHGPTTLTQLSVEGRNVAVIDGDRMKIQWWRYEGSGQVEFCSHLLNSVSGEYQFLTSGDNFTCALNKTYNVQYWGLGAKLIKTSVSGMHFSNITAGGGRLCGLNKIGHVICTGDQSIVPFGQAFEFTNLAIGSSQTCAISRRNGSVVCWGQHGSYLPMGRAEFESIVAGGDITCGFTTDIFIVVCWGLNGTNSSVIRSLPNILPGVCIPNKTLCSCGVYPDSGDLCGGSGVICKKYGTATMDSCQFSPPEKMELNWLGKLIACVIIGMLFQFCCSLYLIFKSLKVKDS